MQTHATTLLELAAYDDESLVGLARSGDPNAFRTLMQRHNRRLYRVARGVVGNDVEAEDVVQEAYGRAFTHLEEFRGEARLSTWLTRIVLNEALGRVRRRRDIVDLSVLDRIKEGQSPILLFSTSSPPASPEAEAARSQLRQMLERAVDELPHAFRAVFVMRDVEDMSIEETAAHLGIRPETVKTRLHRARRLLRSALNAQVASALKDTFPFDGARCARMAERVMQRLAQGGSLPSAEESREPFV